jgi:hypothetical protein
LLGVDLLPRAIALLMVKQPKYALPEGFLVDADAGDYLDKLDTSL